MSRSVNCRIGASSWYIFINIFPETQDCASIIAPAHKKFSRPSSVRLFFCPRPFNKTQRRDLQDLVVFRNKGNNVLQEAMEGNSFNK